GRRIGSRVRDAVGGSKRMNDLPNQAAGIEINPVPDGYVLYQPERDRIHYLNYTAAIVFEFCNGRHRSEEIAELLQQAYDLPTSPRAEIDSCLASLRREGLIT